MTDAVGERKRRWPAVVIVIAVLLAALVAAALIADAVARSYAENLVKGQVTENLPGADDVDVQIGGGSFLVQLAQGAFDDVRVNASGVELGGAAVDLGLHARGVPTDPSKPIAAVTGSAKLRPEALQSLLEASGQTAQLGLGDGTVSYQVERTVLGIPLAFTVTAEPEAAGSSIVFHPTGAEATAGGVAVDVSGVVDALVSDSGISVCVASELPQGVSVDAVSVQPDAVVVRFSAKDVALSDLATSGAC